MEHYNHIQVKLVQHSYSRARNHPPTSGQKVFVTPKILYGTVFCAIELQYRLKYSYFFSYSVDQHSYSEMLDTYSPRAWYFFVTLFSGYVRGIYCICENIYTHCSETLIILFHASCLCTIYYSLTITSCVLLFAVGLCPPSDKQHSFCVP